MSGFEPDCHAHFSGPADPERVALVSIAISLKRMADGLQELSKYNVIGGEAMKETTEK